jgi:hypothetical protein
VVVANQQRVLQHLEHEKDFEEDAKHQDLELREGQDRILQMLQQHDVLTRQELQRERSKGQKP